MESLVARAPYFVPDAIPADPYPGLDAPIPTVGVVAFLVTRADMEDKVVEAMLAALRDGGLRLRRAAPVLAGATPESLRAAAGETPLHPAAEAALDEE